MSDVRWIIQVLVAVGFLTLGMFFSQETLVSKSESGYSMKQQLTMALKLAHLLSFSIAWGAIVWAIFISGIIMFRNLPRHLFGNFRRKLFPTCFTMVTVCSSISLASFGYLHPWRSSSCLEKYQLWLLLSSFVFNLSNLFFFSPMTIEMMKQRHKVEREENIGKEIGWWKNREVAKVNSKLAAMNNKFNLIHGFSALVTILSFGSLAMHSLYLASKINL